MPTTIEPYIFFDGNCAEAADFYGEVFGGEVSIMTFEDSPMDVPAEQKERVMHASVKVGQATLFLSDSMDGAPVEAGMRAHISVSADDAETGGKYFEALSDGGEVTMPFDKQFWGDTFGMVTDRYGVKWMVSAAG